MVKVTQEQKRTLKKFVALGLELGTLGSYDIWEIHYLLTHTNPGIADNDRAPHPANTADEYGPYHAGSMMGVNLGTNGMWEIWHRARDIAANEAEKNEIDKMARSVFIQIAQLGAERHRLKVEDRWPGLLVEDEGGYAMTGNLESGLSRTKTGDVVISLVVYVPRFWGLSGKARMAKTLYVGAYWSLRVSRMRIGRSRNVLP